MLGWIVLPVAKRLYPPETRQEDCRRLIHRSLGAFLTFMRVSGVLKVTVHGREHLRDSGGALIIANHPTLIDFIAIVGLVPEVNCLVKRSLCDHFFVREAVRAAGYIVNDDPVKTVDSASRMIRRNQAVVIFPEGTRSPREGLRKFRRGAASIAVTTGCPVIPVFITMHPPNLMKGQKWYQIPPRQAHLTLRIAPGRTDWSDTIPDEPRALAARKTNRAFKHYFQEKLAHG